MNLRLLHIEFTAPRAERMVRLRAPQEPAAIPFRFVTYAAEIEGEAPLIAIQEAVDD